MIASTYFAPLFCAAFWAMGSWIMMSQCVREEVKGPALVWAISFVVSSLVSAYYFWRMA